MNPIVMGILDVSKPVDVIAYGERVLRDGASMIDVVYQSDAKLSVQDELKYLIPAIDTLSKRIAIPISVHTSNPEVMQAAAEFGAKYIVDDLALTKPGAIATVAKIKLEVCLRDSQKTMLEPVSEVYQYLEQRVAKCVEGGIEAKKIGIDPGLGRSLQHSLAIIRALAIFEKLNCSIMLNMSAENMVGQILDVPLAERTYGNVAATVIAISNGADIIRTMDIKATADAIKVIKAIAAI